MSKVTNEVSIEGKVVGTYPMNKDDSAKGGMYRLVFMTRKQVAKGESPIVKNYIFVKTSTEMPRMNDVVRITGVLNIDSNKLEDGRYETKISLLEETRGFIREGQPEPSNKTQKQDWKTQKKEYTPRKQEAAPPVRRATIEDDMDDPDGIPF